ncbi:hypothetical protein BE20_11930 [Sorangium cellulosum]|nr:hypothetical protein BE20_11930 [Sorangium cellulosum]
MQRALSPCTAHTAGAGRATILRAGEDHAMTHELRHLSHELNVPLQAHVIVTPSGRYAAVME